VTEDREPGAVDAPSPSDNTTLMSVLEGYLNEGWDGELRVVEGGAVECATCHTTTPAEEVVVHSLRRLEGASDPADMTAVLAVSCEHCGERGAVVVRYGPEASADEATLLLRAQDERGDAAAPRARSPHEGPPSASTPQRPEASSPES
jgi:hypothetical protein